MALDRRRLVRRTSVVTGNVSMDDDLESQKIIHEMNELTRWRSTVVVFVIIIIVVIVLIIRLDLKRMRSPKGGERGLLFLGQYHRVSQAARRHRRRVCGYGRWDKCDIAQVGPDHAWRPRPLLARGVFGRHGKQGCGRLAPHLAAGPRSKVRRLSGFGHGSRHGNAGERAAPRRVETVAGAVPHSLEARRCGNGAFIQKVKLLDGRRR